MSEVPETVIEEDSKNNNEELSEKVEEPKAEEIKVETPEETTKEEAPKEDASPEARELRDEQFKNKTDSMKNKKVKREGCQAEMTLKTLRYSHKCNGKTEDKPIKPKPKTRAVAIKPIENQVIKTIPPTKVKEPVIQYSEPIEVKTKQQPIIVKPPPPRQPTATELIQQSYNEMKRFRQQEKQEKINRFRASMF